MRSTLLTLSLLMAGFFSAAYGQVEIIKQEVEAGRLISVDSEMPALWVVNTPRRDWPMEVAYSKDGVQKCILWTGSKSQVIEIQAMRNNPEGDIPIMVIYQIKVAGGVPDDGSDDGGEDDGSDIVIPDDPVLPSRFNVGSRSSRAARALDPEGRSSLIKLLIQADIDCRNGSFPDAARAAQEVTNRIRSGGFKGASKASLDIRKIFGDAWAQKKINSINELGLAYREAADWIRDVR